MSAISKVGLALDRALEVLAPVWARKRILARAHTQLIRRSFEATPVGRTSARPYYRLESPRAAVQRDIETTRAQARDLYRYNPYARGTVNTIVANLVGCGIKPQGRVMLPKKGTLDEKFNDASEEAWERWAEAADVTGRESFYEQQEALEREIHVAGEAILVLGAPTDGRRVPIATEVISSERLALKDAEFKDGTKIIQGVEFSKSGQIAAYWVYPNHPSEGMLVNSEPQRILADSVIHYHDKLEPGQIRGLTKFLTVAGAFEGFVQWLDWLLLKERTASAFALAIKRNGALINTPFLAGDTPEDTDDEGEEDLDRVDGAIIAHLRPGEDVTGINSGVQAASVDLLSQVLLRAIARGLDVSYELVSRDLSRVTYLSARQGENQDRRHWEPQQERLNRRVNRPLWAKWMRSAQLVGEVPRRGDSTVTTAVDFVRPGWPWIDPQKEIDADVAAIQAGIESPMEVITRRGHDPYKVLTDIETFKQWAEEKGLKLSIFEPKVAASAPPPAENGANDGEAEAKTQPVLADDEAA